MSSSFIKVSTHYKPFILAPGQEVFIPGTCFSLMAYPAKLVIKNIEDSNSYWEAFLDVPGPCFKFQVVCDLERSTVSVRIVEKEIFFQLDFWGETKNLFIQLIRSSLSKIKIKIKQGNLLDLKGNLLESNTCLSPKTPYTFSKNSVSRFFKPFVAKDKIKMCFGYIKKQELISLSTRKNLGEWIPLIHRVSQSLNTFSSENLMLDKRIFPELNHCLSHKEHDRLASHLMHLFFYLFKGLLVPSEAEPYFLGGKNPCLTSYNYSVYEKLIALGKILEELFFLYSSQTLSILPHLPPELHCGRIKNLVFEKGRIDLLWSKKRIKKLCLMPTESFSASFSLQSDISSFRLRETLRGTGKVYAFDSTISFKKDHCYYIDKFQK